MSTNIPTWERRSAPQRPDSRCRRRAAGEPGRRGHSRAALIRAYRDWSLEASRDQTAWTYLGTGSEAFRQVAPELVGRRYVGFTATSLDVSDESRARLAQIERFRLAVGMRDAQHLGGWSVMGDERGEDIADAIRWARDAWQVLASARPESCWYTWVYCGHGKGHGLPSR